MDALQICQFIIGYINTQGEEQSGITPVDYLVCTELHEES